jgi:hypothetical protein
MSSDRSGPDELFSRASLVSGVKGNSFGSAPAMAISRCSRGDAGGMRSLIDWTKPGISWDAHDWKLLLIVD